MSFLDVVRRWLGLLLEPTAYRAQPAEEEPEELAARTVYLIGDGDAPWSASLICPCGCGEVIRLSLLPDDRPRWSVRVAATGAVSLHPSIWRMRGCRSHFFIRNGRVLWAPPDDREPVLPSPRVKSSSGWRA